MAQTDVFDLLSNERRCRSIEYIVTAEDTTLRALADLVAADEAGTDTPSDAVRTAVYVSLRQVHLPRLAEAGLVEFDADENTVRVLPRARGVTLYLELVTRYGVTWGECYQYIGITGFLTVLGSLLALPVLDALPTLVWTTAFLALFAAVSAYQLLADRRTPTH
ncbi:DUF7344 domain-containing protein [Salarchaeum japonicum]|uniref:DUF7344 domain-containing protein n=1 Tax=Salarchaeum japonicum TaxID=555573 RepID=UPI003C77A439